MRYSLFASLSLILLLGTACRKNDTNRTLGVILDSITTSAVSNNSIMGGIKFKYDGNGNLVQYIVDNNRTTQFRYDAQNRLTNVSAYSNTYPGSSFGDTLVYSANGRIVRSYRYASGTTSLRPSRVYVFDNNNRLIFDSIYSTPFTFFASAFFKYNYNANNDLQSVIFYAFNSTGSIGYTPGDSLVHTYDTYESPFYKYSFALYNVYFNTFNRSLPSDLIVYDPNMGIVFSKHNPVLITSFRNATAQPGTVNSFNSTYYSNGLIHTQVMGYSFSANYDIKSEFLYR